MLAGFIVTAFFKINYSLGLAAAMLYLAATGGTEAESYKHLAADAPYVKDYEHPILISEYFVSEELTLIELLRMLKSNKSVKFRITDKDRKVIKTIDEEELGNLCLKYDLRTKLKLARSD